MLILSHTDGLRIDLHQFRQRILYSSCNGCRASLSHVKIRKFFRRQFAGGIDRSSRFIGDHIRNFLRNLFQDLHDDLFGFPACGSISHRNQRHSVSMDQFFDFVLCRLDLPLIGRSGRIYDSGIQHLSGLIHNRQLASGTERRIPSKHHLSGDRRLQKQLFQILSKDAD